VGVE
jgi:hypothetical protein